jgi:hypothetical protein
MIEIYRWTRDAPIRKIILVTIACLFWLAFFGVLLWKDLHND